MTEKQLMKLEEEKKRVAEIKLQIAPAAAIRSAKRTARNNALRNALKRAFFYP